MLGFAIAMILIVLFTIGNGNYVYAVEYTTYTSEKHGIQFEYPFEWELIEKTSRSAEGPGIKITHPDTIPIITINTMVSIPKTLQLEETLELWVEHARNSFETRIIETPSILKIDNQVAGTFVTTDKQKHEQDIPMITSQTWVIPLSNKDYMIIFGTIPENFDNPENIEIRKHFINSIKFLHDTDIKKTTNSVSRFN